MPPAQEDPKAPSGHSIILAVGWRPSLGWMGSWLQLSCVHLQQWRASMVLLEGHEDTYAVAQVLTAQT